MQRILYFLIITLLPLSTFASWTEFAEQLGGVYNPDAGAAGSIYYGIKTDGNQLAFGYSGKERRAGPAKEASKQVKHIQKADDIVTQLITEEGVEPQSIIVVSDFHGVLAKSDVYGLSGQQDSVALEDAPQVVGSLLDKKINFMVASKGLHLTRLESSFEPMGYGALTKSLITSEQKVANRKDLGVITEDYDFDADTLGVLTSSTKGDRKAYTPYFVLPLDVIQSAKHVIFVDDNSGNMLNFMKRVGAAPLTERDQTERDQIGSFPALYGDGETVIYHFVLIKT